MNKSKSLQENHILLTNILQALVTTWVVYNLVTATAVSK
jgi:hypothetical protein